MTVRSHWFGKRVAPVQRLDERQERLVEILEAAAGQPVSFAELHRRGIRNPATLAYELEAAGVPITHVQREFLAGQPLRIGITLEPGWREASAPSARRAGPSRLRDRRTNLPSVAVVAGRSIMVAGRMIAVARRMIAVARRLIAFSDGRVRGVLERSANTIRVRLSGNARVRARPGSRLSIPGRALGGAVVLLAVTGLTVGLVMSVGGAPAKGPSGHARSRLVGRGALLADRRVAASAGTISGVQAARADSAARLQAEGQRLLELGRYGAAIDALRAAIAASGQSPARCAKPSTRGCLTYADGLYDLGRALVLDHDPVAAVRVLRKRLQIDSQRSAVQHQLAIASQQLPPSAPPPAPTILPPPAPAATVASSTTQTGAAHHRGITPEARERQQRARREAEQNAAREKKTADGERKRETEAKKQHANEEAEHKEAEQHAKEEAEHHKEAKRAHEHAQQEAEQRREREKLEHEESNRHEEEAAAKKRQEEEAAAKKRQEEEATAKKHQEEEAAAKKRQEEEAAAAAKQA